MLQPALFVNDGLQEINRLDNTAIIIRGNNNIPKEKNIFDVIEPVKAVPIVNTPIMSMQPTKIFVL